MKFSLLHILKVVTGFNLFLSDSAYAFIRDELPYINEIHYDNLDADENEGVEVAVSFEDTNVYEVFVLGSEGVAVTYRSDDTSVATISAPDESGIKYIVFRVSLSNEWGFIYLRTLGSSQLEMLSYEGLEVPYETGIGVVENGDGPINFSLQRRIGSTTWDPPRLSTFGAANVPVSVVPTGVLTTEPMSAPTSANPTAAPDTSNSPTADLVTLDPTASPVASNPTTARVTSKPTTAPVTSKPTAAPVTSNPNTRDELPYINEIHYDNLGADENEGVEVAVSFEDTNVYEIFVLGSEGVSVTYRSDDTSVATISAPDKNGIKYIVFRVNLSNGQGFIYLSIPGSDWGFELERLSYEGYDVRCEIESESDIGVSEDGTGPNNFSLQRRIGSTTWDPPRLSTFGAANVPIDVVVAPTGVLTTEPMSAPISANPTAAPLNDDDDVANNDDGVDAPVTSNPTAAPVTSKPTATPVTSKPTATPVTSKPTATPVTSKPTRAPRTPRPTRAPRTPSPTRAPRTLRPTRAPRTPRPTRAPRTPSPTRAPRTLRPTRAPRTPRPTRAPRF